MKQPWPWANGSVPYLWSSLPNSLNKLRTCKIYTIGPKEQELFTLLFPDLVVPPSTRARTRRKRIDHKSDGAKPAGQSVPQSPSEGNRPIKLYFSFKGVDTKALRQSEQHHFCVGCYYLKKIYAGTLAGIWLVVGPLAQADKQQVASHFKLSKNLECSQTKWGSRGGKDNCADFLWWHNSGTSNTDRKQLGLKVRAGGPGSQNTTGKTHQGRI